MNKKLENIFDDLLFFCILLCSQFIIIHGKAISMHIFAHNVKILSDGYNYLSIYISILTISIMFLILKRNTSNKIKRDVFLISLIGFIGAGLIQYFSNSTSTLILFLSIYLYAICGVVIILSNLFNEKMQLEFWILLFDYMIKLIKYLLVLYGAIIAISKFVVHQKNETASGFLTTLSYPTLIVLVSLFMIAYWIMIPTLLKIIEGYKIKKYKYSNYPRIK